MHMTLSSVQYPFHSRTAHTSSAEHSHISRNDFGKPPASLMSPTSVHLESSHTMKSDNSTQVNSQIIGSSASSLSYFGFPSSSSFPHFAGVSAPTASTETMKHLKHLNSHGPGSPCMSVAHKPSYFHSTREATLVGNLLRELESHKVEEFQNALHQAKLVGSHMDDLEQRILRLSKLVEQANCKPVIEPIRPVLSTCTTDEIFRNSANNAIQVPSSEFEEASPRNVDEATATMLTSQQPMANVFSIDETVPASANVGFTASIESVDLGRQSEVDQMQIDSDLLDGLGDVDDLDFLDFDDDAEHPLDRD